MIGGMMDDNDDFGCVLLLMIVIVMVMMMVMKMVHVNAIGWAAVTI